MGHGFVDDIPGHSEFWRRFWHKEDYRWRRNDYKTTWKKRWKKFKWNICGKQYMRIGMLGRLWEWKKNIRKLRKIYPDYTLRDLENTLIYIEVDGIIHSIMDR